MSSRAHSCEASLWNSFKKYKNNFLFFFHQSYMVTIKDPFDINQSGVMNILDRILPIFSWQLEQKFQSCGNKRDKDSCRTLKMRGQSEDADSIETTWR